MCWIYGKWIFVIPNGLEWHAPSLDHLHGFSHSAHTSFVQLGGDNEESFSAISRLSSSSIPTYLFIISLSFPFTLRLFVLPLFFVFPMWMWYQVCFRSNGQEFGGNIRSWPTGRFSVLMNWETYCGFSNSFCSHFFFFRLDYDVFMKSVRDHVDDDIGRLQKEIQSLVRVYINPKIGKDHIHHQWYLYRIPNRDYKLFSFLIFYLKLVCQTRSERKDDDAVDMKSVELTYIGSSTTLSSVPIVRHRLSNTTTVDNE